MDAMPPPAMELAAVMEALDMLTEVRGITALLLTPTREEPGESPA